MEEIGDVTHNKEEAKKYAVYALVIGIIITVLVMVFRNVSGATGGTSSVGGGGGGTISAGSGTDYASQLAYQQGLAQIQNSQATLAEQLQKDLLGAQTQANISSATAQEQLSAALATTQAGLNQQLATTQNQLDIAKANNDATNQMSLLNAQTNATIQLGNAQEAAQAALATVQNQLDIAKANNDTANQLSIEDNKTAYALTSFEAQLNDLLNANKQADNQALNFSAQATSVLGNNLIILANVLNGKIGNTTVGNILGSNNGQDLLSKLGLFNNTGSVNPIMPTPYTGFSNAQSTAPG